MSSTTPTADVDLFDLVFDYVRLFPLAKDVRSKVNLDDLGIKDLDLTRFRVSHQQTIYNNTLAPNGGLKSPPTEKKEKNNNNATRLKSYVVFSSEFANNTSMLQSNNLRTERRTSTQCRLRLAKAVTMGGSFNLQISPPGGWIQASGGFRKEVSMQKEKETVTSEELTWSLDTKIEIPAGYRTRADLVVTEEEYESRFHVKTIFEGRIIVNLHDKRDGSIASIMCLSDLSRVFKPDKGFHPCPDVGPGAVFFVSEGSCQCSCGIKQHVELHQEMIGTYSK